MSNWLFRLIIFAYFAVHFGNFDAHASDSTRKKSSVNNGVCRARRYADESLDAGQCRASISFANLTVVGATFNSRNDFLNARKLSLPTRFADNVAGVVERETTTRRLKILVAAVAHGWSHMQFMGAIADTLALAGHTVDFLPIGITSLGNYTATKKSRHIWRHRRRSSAQKNPLDKVDFSDDCFTRGYKHPAFARKNHVTRFFQPLAENCANILADATLLRALVAERYDVGIAEIYEPCMIGVFERVGVKTSIASLAVAYEPTYMSWLGLPAPSSYTKDLWQDNFVDPLRMSFWERALNFASNFYIYNILNAQDLAYRYEQPLFDATFGGENPRLSDVFRNVSLLLLNTHEFFALPRPTSPKVVHIGGIVEEWKGPQRLSKEFAELADSSADGVVIFSMGTYADARYVGAEQRAAFLDAFARFPRYTFIWKFYMRDKSRLPRNVHVFDWLPQTALLAHPKTRAFITHCGLNSLNEAMRHGVAVIGIPLFGDQFHNAAILLNRRVGVTLKVAQLRDATQGATLVADALAQVLRNGDANKFRRNARQVKRKMALAPTRPAERLVKWTEFAAEFGDLNDLNLPTVEEMGVIAYYCIDVVAAAFVALASLAFSVAFVVKRIFFCLSA